MKFPTKISTCFLLTAVAVMLAGCGSHDQSTPSTNSATGGTPPDVINAAKKQSQDMNNHPPPAQGAPAAPATH